MSDLANLTMTQLEAKELELRAVADEKRKEADALNRKWYGIYSEIRRRVIRDEIRKEMVNDNGKH